MPTPCELIAVQIGSLFDCEAVGEQVRIRTPFLYPDGDVIDIFLTQDKFGFLLSDMGETLRWLRMQTGATGRRTKKQERVIQDICLTCGVSIFEGCILIRTEQDKDFADQIVRLSQACLKIADLWFTFRIRGVQTATDEVAEFLEAEGVQFQRGQPIQGHSGREWMVDFQTLSTRLSLVQVLTTGSRGASHRIAEHVLSQWYDLRHLAASSDPARFVSLFDDTVDVWSEEDFNLVADLSQVAFWSRPDEFLHALTA